MLFILFLSYFIVNSMGQIPLEYHHKPNITSMLNLDKSKITGKWYEILRIPNYYEIDDKCSVITYELDQQSGSLKLILDAVKIRNELKHKSVAAVLPKNNKTGEFILRHLIVPPIDLGSFYILDTDYSNYLVAAAVKKDFKSSFMFAWINSRTQKLSAENHKRAVEALKAHNIPFDALKNVTQDCSTRIE